jgi:hypothetical protein
VVPESFLVVSAGGAVSDARKVGLNRRGGIVEISQPADGVFGVYRQRVARFKQKVGFVVMRVHERLPGP